MHCEHRFVTDHEVVYLAGIVRFDAGRFQWGCKVLSQVSDHHKISEGRKCAGIHAFAMGKHGARLFSHQHA